MVKAEQVYRFFSSPLVQWNFRRLSKRDETGRTMVDHVFAAYARQEKVKFKYLPYFLFISLLPGFLKMSGKKLVREFYSERFYRRAIANVVESVVEFGLSTPQVLSSPVLVVWNFTNSCNLSCKHCYQNARNALPDELTLKERLMVIDELDRNDVTSLAFSGGEPLIHKDFWPVAAYAHGKGMHLSVATNGTLISKEVAKRLKETGVNYVEISVDSADPASHDAFRGGTGYWARSVDGIRNCVEAGLDTGMATTATRRSFREIDDLLKLAKELKVNSFYAFNFIPAGRGKAIVEDDLTPQMREELLGKLYDTFLEGQVFAFSTCPQYGRFCHQKAPGDVIVNSHYFYLKGQQAKMLADYIGGCGAGRLYCAVQPNGMITPCVFMPIMVGDLRKERLADIWRNSKVMKDLRDRSAYKEHCGNCEYRAMCGGCRARAFGYSGDYMGADPGCLNNMSAWEELAAGHAELSEQEIC